MDGKFVEHQNNRQVFWKRIVGWSKAQKITWKWMLKNVQVSHPSNFSLILNLQVRISFAPTTCSPNSSLSWTPLSYKFMPACAMQTRILIQAIKIRQPNWLHRTFFKPVTADLFMWPLTERNVICRKGFKCSLRRVQGTRELLDYCKMALYSD